MPPLPITARTPYSLDHVRLIRLLANARRRARRLHRPLLAFLQHHRTAVIQHRAVQIHRRRVLHQVRMHGVAAGVHLAR